MRFQRERASATTPEAAERAAFRQREIDEAWAVLRSPADRARYDDELRATRAPTIPPTGRDAERRLGVEDPPVLEVLDVVDVVEELDPAPAPAPAPARGRGADADRAPSAAAAASPRGRWWRWCGPALAVAAGALAIGVTGTWAGRSLDAGTQVSVTNPPHERVAVADGRP